MSGGYFLGLFGEDDEEPRKKARREREGKEREKKMRNEMEMG